MYYAHRLPRSFHWLNICQCLGAFNDNLFKLLVLFQLIALYGKTAVVSLSATVGFLFVLPFIVFAPFTGILADRFDRIQIIRIAKCAEIITMGLGTLFFSLESVAGLYCVLFLMSLQSVVIGPAKSGLLPEITGTDLLAKANGTMVLSSYVAIIAGTGAASLLSIMTGSNYLLAGFGCMSIALLGSLCSFKITYPEKHQYSTRVLLTDNIASVKTEYRHAIRLIRTRPSIWLPIVGSAAFLFIGAFVQLAIVPYGMTALHLTREQSGYLFLLAAIGIGTGAGTAGKCSPRFPNLGLLSIGSFGILAASLALLLWGTSTPVAGILLFVLGWAGGLFIVPVTTCIQASAPTASRGKILGVSYFLNFLLILAAAGLLSILGTMSFPVRYYFIVPMITGAVLCIGSIIAVPRWQIRLVIAMVIRCAYRLKIRHANNVPVHGPAIIVFNHVSWIDGLIAMTSLQRPAHFLMKRSIFERSFLRPLFALGGIIPVSFSDGPHTLHTTLECAKSVLKKGGTIALFPEGAISRDGFLHRCRSGYHALALATGAPIIPAYIDGAWGSCFSYSRGKLGIPVRPILRRRISVTFGAPLPPDTAPDHVRSSIESCCVEASRLHPESNTTLAKAFIKSDRRNWCRQAMNDSTGRRMSFGETLIAATLLAGYLADRSKGNRMVGIMLPASAGGALVNIAVTLAGKIPVNLNFTASNTWLASAVHRCRLTTVVTSRQFMTKVSRPGLQLPFIFVEDLIRQCTIGKKITAVIKAMVFPVSLFGRSTGASTDDCAAILFSSGSTAEPKGIMLSHRNILANIASMQQAMMLTRNDVLCTALPLFHSFGFTVTVWYPLLHGFKVCYHADPLDGKTIANLVKSNNGTLLLATPTFLHTYLRKAEPEDFASLRLVITGAEHLKPSLGARFMEKFNLQPLQGYGSTECSPVISLNVPDTASPERSFKGYKPGTVGRPLPGITVKIVDPQTGAPLKTGNNGMLLVKGANVMNGYLEDTENTARVLQEGWYVTGDIASLDEDGFITLSDRLSRFSKIGGEMVPHGAVEEIFSRALGSDGILVAVTSVNDEQKGEKLAVVYTEKVGTPDSLARIIDESDLPNLWKPYRNCYVPINALPILGTGKLDLGSIKRYADAYLNVGSLVRSGTKYKPYLQT